MSILLQLIWQDFPRTAYIVFCSCAVLFLAFTRKSPFWRELCHTIVFPSLVLLVLLLNPLTAYFLTTKFELTRSIRFFWLVPATLLIAIVTAKSLDLTSSRLYKWVNVMAVVAALCVLSHGFPVLRDSWENTRPNWYKVPPIVVTLDDYIMEDPSGLEKTAVFPMPLNLWVRQYRPEIILPFEWTKIDRTRNINKQIYSVMNAGKGDLVNLTKLGILSAEGGYNYIVLAADGDYIGSLADSGYKEIYRVDLDPRQDTDDYDKEYILYRIQEAAQ